MKKFITLVCIGMFFISCSKDDSSPNSSLTDSPSAKAVYDTSNFGIYKGVFVGSSGTVLININNDGSISATITIDGVTYNFTTSGNVIENENINLLKFTSGSLSFDFNVNSDGSNPNVNNIVFSAHPNADISVVKEDSEHIVKCYQGTYSGDNSGTFNFTISDNELLGLATGNSYGDSFNIRLEGTLSGNSIMGYVEDAGLFSGSISGDSVSGTWNNSDTSNPENGTWTGSRTL